MPTSKGKPAAVARGSKPKAIQPAARKSKSGAALVKKAGTKSGAASVKKAGSKSSASKKIQKKVVVKKASQKKQLPQKKSSFSSKKEAKSSTAKKDNVAKSVKKVQNQKKLPPMKQVPPMKRMTAVKQKIAALKAKLAMKKVRTPFAVAGKSKKKKITPAPKNQNQEKNATPASVKKSATTDKSGRAGSGSSSSSSGSSRGLSKSSKNSIGSSVRSGGNNSLVEDSVKFVNSDSEGDSVMGDEMEDSDFDDELSLRGFGTKSSGRSGSKSSSKASSSRSAFKADLVEGNAASPGPKSPNQWQPFGGVYGNAAASNHHNAMMSGYKSPKPRPPGVTSDSDSDIERKQKKKNGAIKGNINDNAADAGGDLNNHNVAIANSAADRYGFDPFADSPERPGRGFNLNADSSDQDESKKKNISMKVMKARKPRKTTEERKKEKDEKERVKEEKRVAREEKKKAKEIEKEEKKKAREQAKEEKRIAKQKALEEWNRPENVRKRELEKYINRLKYRSGPYGLLMGYYFEKNRQESENSSGGSWKKKVILSKEKLCEIAQKYSDTQMIVEGDFDGWSSMEGTLLSKRFFQREGSYPYGYSITKDGESVTMDAIAKFGEPAALDRKPTVIGSSYGKARREFNARSSTSYGEYVDSDYDSDNEQSSKPAGAQSADPSPKHANNGVGDDVDGDDLEPPPALKSNSVGGFGSESGGNGFGGFGSSGNELNSYGYGAFGWQEKSRDDEDGSDDDVNEKSDADLDHHSDDDKSEGGAVGDDNVNDDDDDHELSQAIAASIETLNADQKAENEWEFEGWCTRTKERFAHVSAIKYKLNDYFDKLRVNMDSVSWATMLLPTIDDVFSGSIPSTSGF